MSGRLRFARDAAAALAACVGLLAAALPDAMAAAEASGDIRDIRGPKLVLPGWLVPAAALLVCAIALGAFGLRAWLGRRRRARTRPPFEAALERLEQIRPLMQPALAREFCIAVSDIVRGYIELRFAVTATHQTTEEFLVNLLESPKPSLLRHRALLSDFLQQCDLVKFAGLSLTVENMLSLHESARAFLLETAKPEPEADKATGDRGAAPAASHAEGA